MFKWLKDIFREPAVKREKDYQPLHNCDHCGAEYYLRCESSGMTPDFGWCPTCIDLGEWGGRRKLKLLEQALCANCPNYVRCLTIQLKEF